MCIYLGGKEIRNIMHICKAYLSLTKNLVNPYAVKV